MFNNYRASRFKPLTVYTTRMGTVHKEVLEGQSFSKISDLKSIETLLKLMISHRFINISLLYPISLEVD